jgi:hypothetical protein
MHKLASKLGPIIPKTAATFTVEVNETNELHKLLRIICDGRLD